MARVFISYRRADGQYAVGWIQERLKSFDDGRRVGVAFFDEQLRGGDPLSGVLASRVEECEILIAVIGPEWRGDHDDGSARILDPDDWVARELSSAFAAGKVVIPVLINGAEPLDRSRLDPSHAEIADLLAIRLDDERGMRRLMEAVSGHLAAADAERALLDGLDGDLALPSLVPGPMASAVLLAVTLVGGVLAGALAAAESDDAFRAVMVTSGLALSTAVGSYGAWYLTILARAVTPRWTRAVVTVLGVVAVLGWVVVRFGAGSELGSWTPVASLFAIVVLAPMMLVAALAVASSPPASPTLADRTLAVGERARAGIVSTVGLSLAGVSTVISSLATYVLVDEPTDDAVTGLVSLGALISLLLGVMLVNGRTRLVSESIELRDSVAEMERLYRRRVEAHLVDDVIPGFDQVVRRRLEGHMVDEPVVRGSMWWIMVPVMAPFVTGVVTAVLVTRL